MSLLKRLQQGESNTPEQSEGLPVVSKSEPVASVSPRGYVPPFPTTQQNTYLDLKIRVQNKLLANLDPTLDVTKTE
ncbi:MAG: CpaF family protein, partial [Anaerolineaceae bacterium]